jgi:hypothetical protein
MTLQVLGKTYRVSFEQHQTELRFLEEEDVLSMGRYEDPYAMRRIYICRVDCLDDGGVGYGTSVCRPPDRFLKETGRNTALGKALSNLGMPRNERTAFWAAYHGRPRPKSQEKHKEGATA